MTGEKIRGAARKLEQEDMVRMAMDVGVKMKQKPKRGDTKENVQEPVVAKSRTMKLRRAPDSLSSLMRFAYPFCILYFQFASFALTRFQRNIFVFKSFQFAIVWCLAPEVFPQYDWAQIPNPLQDPNQSPPKALHC